MGQEERERGRALIGGILRRSDELSCRIILLLFFFFFLVEQGKFFMLTVWRFLVLGSGRIRLSFEPDGIAFPVADPQ